MTMQALAAFGLPIKGIHAYASVNVNSAQTLHSSLQVPETSGLPSKPDIILSATLAGGKDMCLTHRLKPNTRLSMQCAATVGIRAAIHAGHHSGGNARI